MADGRDTIDRQLIGLLLVNARQSITELARQLGVGRTTVHERIARLEKSGLITGYSAILSEDPFDDYVQAFVTLSIVQKRQKDVLAHLQSLPEVISCYTISGDFDLLAVIQAPRLEDIDAVLDEILGYPGVERCRSSMVLTRAFQRGGALVNDTRQAYGVAAE
ncbi:Lrp/AsnC family transcriptional regulator [Pelagibacterium lacus]|uniref:Lrp/AsnC family transcriptional regulator n=1 Tax=Pelagibacterium lacus TaxID=2282655 RepID=A0A369W3F4_9HYPH|nr:Lrp/AsnC family transcriptional regulator [Pelagibacterium lacus]RDE08873.1 Lrp/AsnC family transcriptional regulator [Pelagibacterium lacus]